MNQLKKPQHAMALRTHMQEVYTTQTQNIKSKQDITNKIIQPVQMQPTQTQINKTQVNQLVNANAQTQPKTIKEMLLDCVNILNINNAVCTNAKRATETKTIGLINKLTGRAKNATIKIRLLTIIDAENDRILKQMYNLLKVNNKQLVKGFKDKEYTLDMNKQVNIDNFFADYLKVTVYIHNISRLIERQQGLTKREQICTMLIDSSTENIIDAYKNYSTKIGGSALTKAIVERDVEHYKKYYNAAGAETLNSMSNYLSSQITGKLSTAQNPIISEYNIKKTDKTKVSQPNVLHAQPLNKIPVQHNKPLVSNKQTQKLQHAKPLNHN